MARGLSAAERAACIQQIIDLTHRRGRLTVCSAVKILALHRTTVLKYFRVAEDSGEVIRHGRLGLFRDQRAIIDFDLLRFGGRTPAPNIGMNHTCRSSKVFQRFLDVQEALHNSPEAR